MALQAGETPLILLISVRMLPQLPRGGPVQGSAGAPDLDPVEALASIGCTLDDICEVVGVWTCRAMVDPSPRMLLLREQEGPFRDAIERGRTRGRVSLQRK